MGYRDEQGSGCPQGSGLEQGRARAEGWDGASPAPPCPGVLLGWGGLQPQPEQLPGRCRRARPAPQAGGRQRGGERHEWLAVSEMGFYGPESSLAPILRCWCQDFAAAWALAAPEVDSPVVPVVGVSGLMEIRLHLRTLR